MQSSLKTWAVKRQSTLRRDMCGLVRTFSRSPSVAGDAESRGTHPDIADYPDSTNSSTRKKSWTTKHWRDRCKDAKTPWRILGEGAKLANM
eukprot:3070369-Amphidinium_carterae.1